MKNIILVEHFILSILHMCLRYSIFIILREDKDNKIEIKMFVSLIFYLLNFFSFMFEDVFSKQCAIRDIIQLKSR